MKRDQYENVFKIGMFKILKDIKEGIASHEKQEQETKY